MAYVGDEKDPPVKKVRSYSSIGGEPSDGGRDDNEECQERNFEEVIESMGPPGRYQICQCLMINTNVITFVFLVTSYVFIGLQPEFSCSPVNETTIFQHNSYNTTNELQVTYEACDIRVTSKVNTSGPIRAVDTRTFECLNGHDFTGGDHVSIVTEWDLVCGSAGIAEMAQSVIAIGWLVGTLIMSISSDKFGRKRTVVFALATCSILILISAFAPNIYVFIALRFLSGVVGPGIMSVAFVLGAEHWVSKHRETYCIFNGAALSLFTLLMCVVAYLLRDHSWRELQICFGVVTVCPLLLMYFVDESASWLYSKGKYQLATKIIWKVCRVNGLDIEPVNKVWDELLSKETKQQNDDKKNAKNYNILDIFRNKKLRMYTVFGLIICLTNEVSYYGMLFTASTLAGSLYLNTVLMSLFEFPAFLVGLVVLKYQGRRFTIISTMSMAAVCLLVSTCLQNAVVPSPDQPANSAATGFFIMGRLALAVCYPVVFMAFPEMYPTTLRSSGIGLCVLGSSLGGILSPYLLPLHDLIPWLPGTCLIALLVVSSVLMSRLPETKGKQLSSNIT